MLSRCYPMAPRWDSILNAALGELDFVLLPMESCEGFKQNIAMIRSIFGWMRWKVGQRPVRDLIKRNNNKVCVSMKMERKREMEDYFTQDRSAMIPMLRSSQSNREKRHFYRNDSAAMQLLIVFSLGLQMSSRDRLLQRLCRKIWRWPPFSSSPTDQGW